MPATQGIDVRTFRIGNKRWGVAQSHTFWREADVRRCGGSVSGCTRGKYLETTNSSNANVLDEEGKMTGQSKRLKFSMDYVISTER